MCFLNIGYVTCILPCMICITYDKFLLFIIDLYSHVLTNKGNNIRLMLLKHYKTDYIYSCILMYSGLHNNYECLYVKRRFDKKTLI